MGSPTPVLLLHSHQAQTRSSSSLGSRELTLHVTTGFLLGSVSRASLGTLVGPSDPLRSLRRTNPLLCSFLHEQGTAQIPPGLSAPHPLPRWGSAAAAANTHTKWAKIVSPIRPDRIKCFLVMS